MARIAPLAILAAAALVASCEKPKVVAPTDRGVCYYLVQKDDTFKFDRIASNVVSIEYCAVELERMRRGLGSVGLDTGDVTGSYNGYFVFLTKYGIYSAQKYDGVRYLMMVRYNGKLVVPGAVPQQ